MEARIDEIGENLYRRAEGRQRLTHLKHWPVTQPAMPDLILSCPTATPLAIPLVHTCSLSGDVC
jgi:hypothetical protein